MDIAFGCCVQINQLDFYIIACLLPWTKHPFVVVVVVVVTFIFSFFVVY